jgi:hypothetical protein
MTIATAESAPSFRKRSRAKIWLRTGILAIFAAIFGISLYRDIAAGNFMWLVGLGVFLVCLPIGFQMRKIVPMQVHLGSQAITMSFDKVYFALILILVVGKAVTGKLLHQVMWSDVLICAILGLMIGRLSGICLRVRGLKREHGFIPGDA